jgi:hypothetical protein
MTDHAATELKLYIDNDGDLYRRQTTYILKNLATKKAQRKYEHELAVKAFGYLADAGAKKYVKEFGSPDQPWNKMFSPSTRRRVAEELTKDFEGEYALGNYDQLLPKKYQKQEKASVGHVRKKVSWRTPESIKVVWSPVNSAWFALWPGRGSIKDQQVIKIAGTDEMDSWLRETYGDPYGRGGPSRGRAHARVRDQDAPKFKIGDIVRRTAARMRSMGVVSGPVNGIVVGYSGKWPLIRWSDMSEADEPMTQAEEGLELDKRAMARRGHARKSGVLLHMRKSPAQLDREIADVVPSWQGGR